MSLKLGQAFSLACLIRYGPLLPIESTGHLKERMALFRSVAWYCLSDDELEQVLQHKEVSQYLYSLVNYAKQYKYAIFKQARAQHFVHRTTTCANSRCVLDHSASDMTWMLTQVVQLVLA